MRAAAVAKTKVQHAVGAKCEVPGVVVKLRRINAVQHPLGSRVGVVGAPMFDPKLRQHRFVAAARGVKTGFVLRTVAGSAVTYVKTSVVAEPGVERDAQQAPFVKTGVHGDNAICQIKKRLIQTTVVALIIDKYLANLINDKQPAGAVSGVCGQYRRHKTLAHVVQRNGYIALGYVGCHGM